MSSDSVQIGIDPRTLKDLMGKLDKLKSEGGRSAYSALMKLAFKIKGEAQLRLTGQGHVKTSRLKNSIHVKGQKPVDTMSYSDDAGKSYNKDLTTVKLKENELAIGTNVEYAAAIEFGSRPHYINSPVFINGVGWRYIKKHPGWKGSSFLYWAMKNVNPETSFAEDFKNSMKFGKGLDK